jgi:hypothetical protein
MAQSSHCSTSKMRLLPSGWSPPSGWADARAECRAAAATVQHDAMANELNRPRPGHSNKTRRQLQIFGQSRRLVAEVSGKGLTLIGTFATTALPCMSSVPSSNSCSHQFQQDVCSDAGLPPDGDACSSCLRANPYSCLLQSLSNLTWSTPDGRPLLSNLDPSFDTDRTGLVGQNGVGKTTPLKLIPAICCPNPARYRSTGFWASCASSFR